MKYVCDANHVFTHTAKRTVDTFVDNPVPTTTTFEVSVCPFCQSLTFKEAPEDPVSSVKQVNYDKVDKLLEQGYTVQSYYASKVTLTKKEDFKGE